jgi:hypothetical protein
MFPLTREQREKVRKNVKSQLFCIIYRRQAVVKDLCILLLSSVCSFQI